jgi:putative phosphoesterase
MRIAVVSDIHGNRTAFEAVLKDLKDTAPDVVFHGGDLADSGSSPAEIVDRIHDLGWQGVVGNTDEMLFAPESLQTFAAGSPRLHSMFTVIEEMAAASRAALGAERLAWLHGLPEVQTLGSLALIHASPETRWRSPGADSAETELESVYGPMGRPVVVYGHIHQPYVRGLASGMTVINSGSVGLPHDGDLRASYLLLDGMTPEIRRVDYEVAREVRALRQSELPHTDWIVRTLESGRPQMP